MPIQLQGGVSGLAADVDAYLRALRMSTVPRGAGYSLSSVTGTIAAALAANSAVYVARNSPTGARYVLVTKLRMRYTTIVAYTTPITAGRRLAVYRGAGAAASGGTALGTPAQKYSGDAASKIAAAQGGDARIATTGALTVAGITFEAQEFRTMALTPFGTAGATYEDVYEFEGNTAPLLLAPGELVAIRNPVLMDAAGTWQLDVDMDYLELASAT